jgi:hypothetical protein
MCPTLVAGSASKDTCDVVSSPNGRTYSPETVAIMTAAFDRVCRSVSHRMNGNEDMRQTLALIIVRHVDRGVRDPGRSGGL